MGLNRGVRDAFLYLTNRVGVCARSPVCSWCMKEIYLMTDLLAARAQMAMSLAFHIIFAAVGIAMPLLMVIAEGLWLKTREEVYLTLAK